MKFFYNICVKGDDAALDGDILSGVRKGYFASFQRIRDKITINSDTASVSYEYTIEKGKPMSWLVRSEDKTVLQDTAGAQDGRYYICFYRDGSLYKRILFSRHHTLLKAEYYGTPAAQPIITLEPRKAPGGLCILYRAGADAQPVILYPMDIPSDGRVRDRVEKDFDNYTVSASTDDGVLRFLSDAQAKTLRVFEEFAAKKLDAEQEESFIGDEAPLFDKINVKDFNVKRNLAKSLDITGADSFTYVREDDEAVETQADAVAQAAESAEADETDALAAIAAAAINEAVGDDAPETELTADEASDAESAEDAEDAEDGVQAHEESAAEPEADMIPPSAAQPDKLIMADGARYSYFGELDANGNRSGFGRTVTEEGRTAYEGHYLNDKRSGVGSYYYKNGSLCYTGEWSENVRHGIGVGVSSHDGSIHVGRWALNKPEGSGVRLSADGEIRFVCRQLGDGSTVLTNYQPDGSITLAKYDENGKKIAEKSIKAEDLFR